MVQYLEFWQGCVVIGFAFGFAAGILLMDLIYILLKRRGRA